MGYVDSAILNLTEWACRKFQVLTGRTNVWLAVQFTNLSIIVYFVWAGVYWWSNDDIAPRVFVGVFCAGLLYVLTQTVFRVPIETYENNAYQRVAKGLRNPRRLRDAPLRISFLTLSILLPYPLVLFSVNLRVNLPIDEFKRLYPFALLTYALIVLTTVVLYLLACDPLPPCSGKLRQWFRQPAASRVATSESPSGE